MTNNDELALKLKAAAEKAIPAIEKYEAGEIDGDDALEMLNDFTDAIKPANILALLAERETDKKLIALNTEMFRNADRDIAALRQRIAELEARTVSVKLPNPISVLYRRDFNDAHRAIYAYPEAEVNAALSEAGIKLEVGE